MSNPQSRKKIHSSEIKIWRDYIETAEELRTLLGSRMQKESGLSLGDYQVLLALSETQEHRLRSSDLASKINWERSRLSHHLGRMESRGLIRRETCPEDNRGSHIALSEAGKVAFRRGSIPHLKAIQDLFFSAFSTDDLLEIARTTSKLRKHIGLANE